MLEENLPQLSIDVFLSQYDHLVSGVESNIRETEIQPVERVEDIETLADFSEQGEVALKKSVMIKLNGGLGTGMGLEKAKTLLKAKNDLSFLEIIIKQVLSQRDTFKSDIPLVFMNSFNTEADTRRVLDKFPEFKHGQNDVPLTFIQNKAPKILADSYEPVVWPRDPSKMWYPPGHGDIYTSLQTSGVLDQLLNKGIKYAFISNADNLGANMDLSVLGYFSEQDASFMMEVADRTEADKKGGHLAQFKDGGLLLRESAQCHDDDIESFQDISQYQYFNTNNLWVRLDRLKALIDENDGVFPLPIFLNKKNVDPRDETSPNVIQIETAMGSAISSFSNSIALRIPKSRFTPVKSCNELLGLWSNAFVLNKSYVVGTNSERKESFIFIDLDKKFYKNIDDLQARFPQGAPDMLECKSLTISGDVKFESNIKLIGDVVIENNSGQQMTIESGTILR